MRMLRTERCKDPGERGDFKEADHQEKTASVVILPKFQDVLSSFLIDLQAAVPSSQRPSISRQCVP